MSTTARDRTTGKDSFVTALRPVRGVLLRDELARRQFAQTQIVLDRLFETGADLGEVHFFQGELHRLRAQPDDTLKAIAAYERALEHEGRPAQVHRGLALSYAKRGDREKARAALERYLLALPDAEDREMLRTQIEGK
jgi:regulator of sirC expression with transglutaminase-like and TPR domain